MLTGHKCCEYGKAIQKQEVKEKRREKAECVRAKTTDLRGKKIKKTERVHLKSLNIKDKAGSTGSRVENEEVGEKDSEGETLVPIADMPGVVCFV